MTDTFQLPPVTSSTEAALQRALGALEDANRLSASLDQQQRTVAAARERHDAAAKALAEREADLALAVDERSALAIEGDVNALAEAASQAEADVARQQRIETALRSRLAAAERVVATERLALESAVREFATSVQIAVGNHVAEAARPLMEALRLAVVTSTAAGASVSSRLLDLNVPDLRNNSVLLFGANLSAYPSGGRIALGDASGDLELTELAAKASEPRLALQRLATYQPRVAVAAEA
ncbi:MAG: hypothetical protein ACTHL8_23310 [Burkholderiaceae bacterium]